MSTIAKTPAPQALTETLTYEGLNTVLQNAAELAGRVLLVILFAASGLGKITGYAATETYMASQGVPGALLPLVILTEVMGSLAIILGWQTRVVAFGMAGFTLLTAFFFHTNFGDQTQMIMFFKNVSIAGAFLMLVAHGAGAYSLDARKN
jgi:putative oxidoreductase